MGEHASQRLLHQRILVLGGELDDPGTRLCSQPFLLSEEDPRADIRLWISSPGGSAPAMLAATLRLIPNDVVTLALGLACSSGRFLLTVFVVSRPRRRGGPIHCSRRAAGR
jgi:ATP-dependent Clp protease protease subunit